MGEIRPSEERIHKYLQEYGGFVEAIADKTSRREAFRYLGYRGTAPDREAADLMEDCIRELCEKLSPRFFAREFPLQITEEGELLFSCFRVKSQDLKRNLEGCSAVILFGATLGAGVDLLLRRYGILDMSRAVVMQAASAAMIEACCNLENRRLEEEYRKRGKELCPRFSPGYGDFPLAFQEQFAAALELEKTVGITLTEGFLMMPSKSVTAVIGVREASPASMAEDRAEQEKEPGETIRKKAGTGENKCRSCGKTDCMYREIQGGGK